MEQLNHTLFFWINAPEHPSTLLLAITTFLAEYVMWSVPILIGIGWLRGSEQTRKIMLIATVSGLTGLLSNQIIGLMWQHPRPFMIGLGHTFIAHVADSSFPSDHVTLLWAVAFSLLMHRSWRWIGVMLAVLGLPVAWARIYLGVHFPFDMAGAAAVALLSSGLAFHAMRFYLPFLYGLALRIHRSLFGPFIQRGWVRP
jgi:undecaprenyl-diphosphatase